MASDAQRLVVSGAPATVIAALRATATRMDVAAKLWHSITARRDAARTRYLLRAGLLDACLTPALFAHPHAITDGDGDRAVEERLGEILLALAGNLLCEAAIPDRAELHAAHAQAAPLVANVIQLFTREGNPAETLWGSHEAWLAAAPMTMGLVANMLTYAKDTLFGAAGRAATYSIVARFALAPPPRAASFGAPLAALGGRLVGLVSQEGAARALCELSDEEKTAELLALGLTPLPPAAAGDDGSGSTPPTCLAEGLVPRIVALATTSPDALHYLSWAHHQLKGVTALRERLGRFEGLEAFARVYLAARPAEWGHHVLALPGLVAQTLQSGLGAAKAEDERGAAVAKLGLVEAFIEDAAWLFSRRGLAQLQASGLSAPQQLEEAISAYSTSLTLLARAVTMKQVANALCKRLPQLRAAAAELEEHVPPRSAAHVALVPPVRSMVQRVASLVKQRASNGAAAVAADAKGNNSSSSSSSSSSKQATQPCRACMKPLASNEAKKCAKCGARYCSKECQIRDWKEGGHKKECKLLRQHTAAAGAGTDCCANDRLLKKGRDLSQAGTAALFDRMPSFVAQAALGGLQLEDCVVVARLLEATEVFPMPRPQFIRMLRNDGHSTRESLAHTEAVLARNAKTGNRLSCCVFGFDDTMGGGAEQRLILKTLSLPEEIVLRGASRWNEVCHDDAVRPLIAMFQLQLAGTGITLKALLENMKHHGMDTDKFSDAFD